MFRDELIKEYQKNGFDCSLAQSELDFVCSILFDLSPVDIMLGKNLPSNFEKDLTEIVRKRLETGRPIQQIVGMGYFLNEKYIVDENVLSPRPETELLVLKAKEIIEKNGFKTFLDIGAGTGCIAISLLKLCPELKGESVDISEKALDIAKRNSDKFGVSDRLTLKKSDLFSEVRGNFDLIISNPPYIPKKDKPSLDREVRDFEPEIALFTNDDEGIEVYQKIISRADKYLNRGGYLMFEIGYNQGKLIEKLFENTPFSDFQLIKDLDNNDRIVLARLL